MAVAAQTTVASLMRKTLDRQAAVARMKISFKKNQIEQVLHTYVRDGNSGPYNELMKILKDNQLNDSNFRVLFEDCLSCVVLLGREMKTFVEVVCNINWVDRDEDLVELYSRFLLSLVTAHTYHSMRIIGALVKLFRADGENWEDTPAPELVSKWSNIHTIIAKIVAVMPMTSDLLMQTVIEQFPYYKAGCFPNRAYIHNLIWMSKYLPSLLEQIMAAIVSKMVDIDTNIVDRDKHQAQDMFDMEMDEKDEVTETLDYCMLEMLKWLEDERDQVLTIMCSVFERVLLPTHGIRHVQFLLLYTISINQQCADRVFTNLWIVAAGLHGLGPGALATRRTAASHLAGLLARCVRVPNSRLIFYLKKMAEWCHSYITATQESTVFDNTKVHGAFHAICHAIFYLVAFKNHHLFMNKESLNFVESLNLPRLVTCNLNPLRTCPPQVTRAFSSVTRSHQVVYCQAIIEKNTRLSLHTAVQKYDEWFPYDPYMLPVSGKIIWPLCMEYKNMFKDGDDETQYNSLKRKLEAEDDDYLMPSPSQKLASSLTSCISPGFKTSESIYM
ncbi:RNA polymerase I-specific transcription initiation factor RRN3 [Maniola hyperantus]|uniref:RNA polymerase I-specific transcription initiation factor RRN3 n=1 Tax=Aphantopus hyperantus TaxID=2795564 RepID=UPI00156A1629|nr:RNA polymerase I-specific transcription initiation factor RRN3 [Maniola hyperantus]